MDTFNSLKANVDRLWPHSSSSVPSLPSKSLPPSAVLRQLQRQVGSPSYLQYQLDLTPSSPIFLTSSPRWGSAAVDEGTGPPFPPPGKARPFAAICSGFPTNVFARPQQTRKPPRSWAGPGIEILHNSNRRTESPALPTHNKQSSVNKTNRHTQNKFLRHQNKNPDQ